MAIYKVTELLDVISQVFNEGYSYIEIEETEGDDEFSTSLGFSTIIDYSSAEGYDEIDAIDIPKDYIFGQTPNKLHVDDIAKRLTFTFDDLVTFTNAITNALEYGKERLSCPDCTREERDDIKSLSVDYRNLQAKLAKFYKRYGIKFVDAS